MTNLKKKLIKNNLYQLNNILTSRQKKTFVFLTFLTFISMTLEILTLNSMLVLLSYMTNPSSLSDSKFFIYFKNLNLNFDLNIIMIFAFVNITLWIWLL